MPQSVKLQLPQDFAAKIADTLNWKLFQVTDTFEVEEGKDGYFYARLKPKKWLDKPDFKMLCTLARDLGGEAYLEGAKAWKVPGPLAKKGPTGPQEKPSGYGIDSQGAYKEPGNALPATPSSSVAPNVKLIPVDAVQIPTFLPTRALISNERLSEIRLSIKKHGLKYPIEVRAGSDPDTYDLIDGYLRLKSVQQLDWKEVPAEITPASDQEVVIDSIITNKDRIEEDPITVAKKLDILSSAFGLTQEKLAEELGVTRGWVSNMVRLLKLPEEVQHCLALSNVSFYQGLLLLQVEDPALQVQLAHEVVSKALSTRQLEERILEVQPKSETPEIPEKHEETRKPSAQDEQVHRDKEIICAHCGEPIEGTPIVLGDGKLYDAECAEHVVAASQPGAIPEKGPVGPLDPGKEEAAENQTSQSSEPAKSEPVDIEEITCRVCGSVFRVRHFGPADHRIQQFKEA